MQACVDWVLIIFGTQVIKKKRPIRPVFPDYLSASYDYGMMYAFVKRPFYTQRIKLIYSVRFYTNRIIVWLIPRVPLKVLGWQGFSIMKFCKCPNLNSLLREIKFLQLPKYSRNLPMLSIIEKFISRKILLRNSWKIGLPFGRRSWKIGSPSWIIIMPLISWHTKLNNWHVF